MAEFRTEPNIAYLESVLYLSAVRIEAESQQWHQHIWLCLRLPYFLAVGDLHFCLSGFWNTPSLQPLTLLERMPLNRSFMRSSRQQWLCFNNQFSILNCIEFPQLTASLLVLFKHWQNFSLEISPICKLGSFVFRRKPGKESICFGERPFSLLFPA